MTSQAHGTFEVTLAPQPPDDNAEESGLSRLSIDKQFHGDLEATSKGTMLAAGTATEGSAGMSRSSVSAAHYRAAAAASCSSTTA